jgi:Ni,Fe-hydrogenase I cytochrome b subunit
MEKKSKRLAGVLLIIFPTVAYGGISLLGMLINKESGYVDNPLRQDLWRAGHAHAGVLLILSLVVLIYVDEANLPEKIKQMVRHGTPLSAILIPAGFFLSVINPDSTEPNELIYLAYVGFAVLIFTFIVLGIGLIKKPPPNKI